MPSEAEVADKQAENQNQQLALGYFDNIINAITKQGQTLDQYNFNIDSLNDQTTQSLDQIIQSNYGEIEGFEKLYGTYQGAQDAIDTEEQNAINEAIAGFNQKLNELGFNAQDANFAFQRTQLQSGNAYDQLGFQLQNAGIDLNNLQLGRSQLNNQIGSAQNNRANLNSQIAQLGLNQDNILLQGLNLGLDSQNIDQQLASLGFDKSILGLRNAQSKLDIDNLRNQISNYGFDLKIADRQIKQTESRITSLALENRKSLIDEKMRRDQFGADMKSQSIDMAKQASDARLSMLQSTLETQQQSGAKGASGRRGKTASSITRTAETLGSINVGAIQDNLSRAGFSFANTTENLTKQNQKSNRKSKLERMQIGEQINQAELDIKNIKSNKRKIRNQIKSTRNQINQTQIGQEVFDLQGQKIDTSMNQLQNNQLKIGNQQATLDNNYQSINKDISQLGRKKDNLNLQIDNLKLDKGKANNNIRKGKNTIKSLTAEQQNVAALLGLSLEEFQADNEKLSLMLQDQASQFDVVIDSIQNDAFKERLKLFNGMPLPPKFADLPIDPLMPPGIPDVVIPPGPEGFEKEDFLGPTPQSDKGGFGWADALMIVGAVAAGVATGGTAAAWIPAAMSGAQAGRSIGGLFD